MATSDSILCLLRCGERFVVVEDSGIRQLGGGKASAVIAALESGAVESAGRRIRDALSLQGEIEVVPVSIAGESLVAVISVRRPGEPRATGPGEASNARELGAVTADAGGSREVAPVASAGDSDQQALRLLCKALARQARATEVHIHWVEAERSRVAYWRKGAGLVVTDAPLSARELEVVGNGNPSWCNDLTCEACPEGCSDGPWFVVPLAGEGKGRGVLAFRPSGFPDGVRSADDSDPGKDLPAQHHRSQEAEMTDSAALLSVAVEQSPDAVTIQDRDFAILYMNPAAEELLGLGRNEARGRKCFSLFHGISEPPAWCPARQALEGGVDSWEETVFEPRLGKWLWIRTRWIPGACDGQPCLVHTVRDVTPLRELQQQLQKKTEQLGEALADLEASRSCLELIVAAAPVGLFTVDPEKGVLEWNAVAERLTGLPREEVLGRPCPFAHRRRPACDCAGLGGKFRRFLVYHWSQGHVRRRHLEVTCTRRDPVGVVGTLVDVTEAIERRKQYQLLLKIANRRLEMSLARPEARALARALLRRTCARAVCLYSFDPDSGGPLLLAQAGLSRPEVAQLRQDTVYCRGWGTLLRKLGTGAPVRLREGEAPEVWLSVFGPGSRFLVIPLVGEGIEGFLLMVGPSCGEVPDWQLDFLTSVGREVSVALVRARVLEDLRQTGRLQLLHEAGTALSRSMELNTILAEVVATFERHMPHLLCSIHLLEADGNGHVVKATSGPDAHLYVGRKLPIEKGIVSLAIRNGCTVYVPDVRSDPRYVPWHKRTRSELVIPLRARGKVIGAFNVESEKGDGFTDEDLQTFTALASQLATAIGNVQLFDEIVRTSEALAIETGKALEASRLKSQFLSNVSHELRTPLNAVLGYSRHVLQEEKQLSEEGRESLRRVIASGEQLLQLVNDLLDLSRIEAGKLSVEIQPVDVRRLAVACLSTVEPTAREKGLRLRLEMPPEVPAVQSDPLRLQQIVLNLLSNAVKFTDQGEVVLRVRKEANELAIDVTDTGIGIDKIHHEAIFESFRQVDGSATRRARGTGLGLAISRKLARLLGGDITVQSELGKGSTFTVHIPCVPPSGVKIGS